VKPAVKPGVEAGSEAEIGPDKTKQKAKKARQCRAFSSSLKLAETN
jgi:Tat protein secretion system quality control protein TatD with DNase activity